MITADLRSDEILVRLGAKPLVAEVGVFRGSLSARLLVRGDLRLVMVDSWGLNYRKEYLNSDDFHANLPEHSQEESLAVARAMTDFAGDRRTIHRMDSVSAAELHADGTFDLVFIDADHTFEGALADIKAWWPKVKRGGYLAGHDFDHPDFPGVRKAIEVVFPDLRVTTGEDYTWFIQKGPIGEWNQPTPDTYDRVIVACVKWGKLYGAEYVNILADSVHRNLDIPHRFVCFTDDARGLDDAITVAPLSTGLLGWWNKIELFAPMAFPTRSRILYLDLDTCITGKLDELVAAGGIIADWHLPTYNSSVMCWTHGEHTDVWNRFSSGAVPMRFHGDQDWITHIGGWKQFPPEWCLSYRKHATQGIPAYSKVVCFHGEPKPHEIADGWVPEFWKKGGMGVVRFISVTNVPEKAMLDNIRQNLELGLPMAQVKRDWVAIVGGGPSLAGCLEDLKTYRTIWALNGAHDYLIERGILPTHMVMLDSREENLRFVRNPRKEVTYLIAAQCHPAVFEALKGFNVVMWVGWVPGVTEVVPAGVIVGGGNTVGLKAMCLAYLQGYRYEALFGYDSCYAADEHHAYQQDLNDGEAMMEDILANGRRFKCARWMGRQARDFQRQLRTMPDLELKVYGDGLIQHIVRTAQAQLAA